jgi:hypothetical protein
MTTSTSPDGDGVSIDAQIRLCRSLFQRLAAVVPKQAVYTPGARKSEEEVSAWEAENGVRLPAGYRAYLREVGDGGAGFTHGNLKKLTAAKGMTQPFPLTRPWAEYDVGLIEEAQANGLDDLEGTPISWLHELPKGANPDDGCICIGYADDGSPYLLVLAGPHADEVWIDCRGYGAGPVFPAMLDDEGVVEWDELRNEALDWRATRFLALQSHWLADKASQ